MFPLLPVADSSIMSLPKPVMRGLLARRLKLHLPIAFVLAIGSAIAFKVSIASANTQERIDGSESGHLVNICSCLYSIQWQSPGSRPTLTSTKTMTQIKSSMPWKKLGSLRASSLLESEDTFGEVFFFLISGQWDLGS